MKTMVKWARILLSLGVAVLPTLLTPLPAVSASQSYNPYELSYGLYWFGLNGANQKFEAGTANAYFDPSKPTLIFVHGWQLTLSYTIPGFDYTGTDTAAAWIGDGWNVGIFVWNQFSDEPSVTDAEAKIWTPNGPKGMRWRDWNNPVLYSAAPPGTPSAAELFYETYVAAMTEYAYTGGNIRIAGHSLGNQMAVRLAELVDDGIAAGDVPRYLRPTRVALLDPYWSPGAKDYLDGRTTGEAVRECVEELLPTGTLFEWYWSSSWTTEPEGDSNADLKPMMLYVAMDPAYASEGLEKHMAAQHLYFWSYAFAGPAACSGDGCLGMTRLLSKMSDDQLAAVMRSDYRWAQNGGASTATPGDDAYQSALQPNAPYTVTQLAASVLTATVGRVVTVTATAADDHSNPVGNGTLVTFGTDLGNISPRSATSDGIAIAQLRSLVPGVAQVAVTTRGTGGTIQGTATVTFTGHCVYLPLALRSHLAEY
jgi:hypothetical protein